ncbi:unnamed protein product [Pedinophyceae sp. YPF-701]|nr:unnamed protein product [Pedinophyceae sp. YPF-701]
MDRHDHRRHRRRSRSAERDRRRRSSSRDRDRRGERSDRHRRDRDTHRERREDARDGRDRHRRDDGDRQRPSERRERRSPSPGPREHRSASPEGARPRYGPRDDRPDTRTCRVCGQEGHIGVNCPTRTCHKCKQPGHIARDCPHAADDGARAAPPPQDDAPAQPQRPPEEPNFGLSGALAQETHEVAGSAVAYAEPPEAKKPTRRWRFYVFKGGEILGDPLEVQSSSWYLFGRDRKVVDIPTDHPSCSKSHAVLQYREVTVEGADGMERAEVRPYVMDLGSTNGTYLNGERIEERRYYQLLERDVVKMGNSSREYVLMDASGV